MFAVNNTGSVWLSLFFRFDGVSAIFVNWNLQILFEDDEFKRVNIRRQLIFSPNWHYIRSRFIDGLFSVFHRCTGNNFYPGYWIAYPTKQSDVLYQSCQHWHTLLTRCVLHYLRANIKHSTWTKVKLYFRVVEITHLLMHSLCNNSFVCNTYSVLYFISVGLPPDGSF